MPSRLIGVDLVVTVFVLIFLLVHVSWILLKDQQPQMGWVFIHSLDIFSVRLLIPPLSARTLNINTIPHHLSVDPFLLLVSLFIS